MRHVSAQPAQCTIRVEADVMSRIKKAAIGGVLAGVFGLVLIPFVWEMEEDIGLDLLFRLRGERAVPNNVVIVTLDKDSATHLNLPPEPYKWPRSLHAQLVDNLNRQGVAVIAFDMIFKEPGPVKSDKQFAEAINRSGNVILCKQLDKDSIPLANAGGSDTQALEIESIVPLVPAIAEAAIASAPFPLR